MSGAIEAAVRPELAAGERLLWTGRPDIVRLAWLRGGKTALFAIPWTAFSLLWTGMAWLFSAGREDSAVFFRVAMVVGPLFVLFGLWLFVTSLIKVFAVGGTLYALTDRRAMIVRRGGHVRSFGAGELGSLYRRGTRRGDIVFSGALPRGSGDPQARAGHLTDYGFFGIADPRGVERLISEQIVKA
jgi:hypothetical protein